MKKIIIKKENKGEKILKICLGYIKNGSLLIKMTRISKNMQKYILGNTELLKKTIFKLHRYYNIFFDEKKIKKEKDLCVVYHKNSKQIKYKGNIKDGKAHGYGELYDIDGKLLVKTKKWNMGKISFMGKCTSIFKLPTKKIITYDGFSEILHFKYELFIIPKKVIFYVYQFDPIVMKYESNKIIIDFFEKIFPNLQIPCYQCKKWMKCHYTNFVIYRLHKFCRIKCKKGYLKNYFKKLREKELLYKINKM
jgi:hypothetical protein